MPTPCQRLRRLRNYRIGLASRRPSQALDSPPRKALKNAITLFESDSQDEDRNKPLLRQPLAKLRDIDQPTGVLAFAEFALALERGDLEADDAALDRDHLRRGAHG